MHHASWEIICSQNSMNFLILFNLESIEAATQATLILETLNLIVQLQQKIEKVLDVPLGKCLVKLTFLVIAAREVRQVFYTIAACLAEINTNFSVVTLKCSEVGIRSLLRNKLLLRNKPNLSPPKF